VILAWSFFVWATLGRHQQFQVSIFCEPTNFSNFSFDSLGHLASQMVVKRSFPIFFLLDVLYFQDLANNLNRSMKNYSKYKVY